MQQADLMQNRFERGWKNAEHRFSTHFAAKLQNKLHFFVARFTVGKRPRCSLF